MSVTDIPRFSEVKGLTDRPRLPRLGKIRLGMRAISAKGNEYPRALDYFNCPDVVKEIYGDKPRELDIVFPSDDVAAVAPAAWKNYTATRGKVCSGDGERAVRLVDEARLKGIVNPSQAQLDDAIATKDSPHVSPREITCPAQDCTFAQRNLCKPVLNLQFLLPKVPGIGCWQLDTGSKNSILDVRGGIQLVMQLSGGRLAGIPLKLRLEPMEVISPEDQKRKIVHTLKLISPATLGKVLMSGERNMRELLMADEGESRSVGLPQLGPGAREVPPPHEPEEDLFPAAQPAGVAQSTGATVGVSAAAAAEERGRTTVEVAGSIPASRSVDERRARAEQLFQELAIAPKDREAWRRLYASKPEDLVVFLEKQRAKGTSKT